MFEELNMYSTDAHIGLMLRRHRCFMQLIENEFVVGSSLAPQSCGAAFVCMVIWELLLDNSNKLWGCLCMWLLQ